MIRIRGFLVSVILLVVLSRAVIADDMLLLREDGPCAMAGFDANGELAFGGEGEPFHTLVSDEMVLVKCKGEDLVNESGQAQSMYDLRCGILLHDQDEPLLAETGSLAVSSDGVGTATCKWEP